MVSAHLHGRDPLRWIQAQRCGAAEAEAILDGDRETAVALLLRLDELVEATSPQRHQVAELPAIAVTVTEHLLHRLRCPECAAQTRAGLPADASRSAFDPRLQAAVTTLAVRNRVSRRDSAELMRELFGVDLAAGSIDSIIQRAGETLAEPYARLAEQIRSAGVVNIDETGWKTAGQRRTLWRALTKQAALFRIAAGRHQQKVVALLSRV